MKRAFSAVAVLFLTGLVWATRLVVGPTPWPPDAASLLAGWLVGLTAVAVVGMLIGSARWARRLGVGVGTVGFLLAAVTSVDILWGLGLALAGLTLIALLGGFTSRIVGDLPPTAGPGPVVVWLLIVLMALPGGVAIVAVNGLDGFAWLGVAAAVLGLIWYAKALPAAVWSVRLLVPAVLVGSAIGTSEWVRPTFVVWSVAVAVLAWKPETLAAVRPLVITSKGRPILAELVPPEILESAGLDERGRRRQKP